MNLLRTGIIRIIFCISNLTMGISGKDVLKEQFALRLSLNTGEYEIEAVYDIDENEIKNIFTQYMEHIGNDLTLFRTRYKQMKEFGKRRILRRTKNNEASRTVSTKVGRNEPCPCGSGKKYKKCCRA